MNDKRRGSGELDNGAAAAPSQQNNNQQAQPPPPPPPPPPPAWRLRLNSGPLRAALADAKARVGPSIHAPFKTRVSKAAVPDYGRFVAPAQEMWLDKVKGRIERSEYESSAQMARDVAAIAAAAGAYNDAERGGSCRAPALVNQARQLAEAVEAALRDRWAEIEQAEAAADRPASAGTSEPNGPDLPLGFEHEVRFTDAKPHGWAEYKICCPTHGEKRVDRLAKLAGFFCAHARCRPAEWGTYARGVGESREEHLERLRPIFAFSKALPPAGNGNGVGGNGAVAAAARDGRSDDGGDDDDYDEGEDEQGPGSPTRRCGSVGGAATLLGAAQASDEEGEGEKQRQQQKAQAQQQGQGQRKGGETLTKHLESAIDGFLSAAGALDHHHTGGRAGGGQQSPAVKLQGQGQQQAGNGGPAARARSLFAGMTNAHSGSPVPPKKRTWGSSVSDEGGNQNNSNPARAATSPLRNNNSNHLLQIPPPPVAPPAAKRSRSAAPPTAALTSGAAVHASSSALQQQEVGVLAAALADAGALADAAQASAARMAGAKGLLAEAASRLSSLDADAATARADAAAARAETAASEARVAALEAEVSALKRRLEEKEAGEAEAEASRAKAAEAAAKPAAAASAPVAAKQEAAKATTAGGGASVSVEARAGWNAAAPAAPAVDAA